MDWRDTGIILSARRHGESAAIVHMLTAEHGRHAGLVRGGGGRRMRSVLQPGNEVAATWRARVSEQLGTFTVELVQSRAALVLDDAARLAAFSAATEILDAALPEREPHDAAFTALRELLTTIATAPNWPAAYARWELALLREVGFALDLRGATGAGAWSVSTRTGVTSAGDSANPENLPLPGFLAQLVAAEPEADEVLRALRVTGVFLQRAVAENRRSLPSRTRLVERLAREATKSGVKTPR